MRRHLVSAFTIISVTVFANGCSSNSGDAGKTAAAGASGSEGGAPNTEAERVEIYSWWIAPGEAEALQALIELHQANSPEDRIYNAAKDSGEATRSELATKIEEGDPPDLFQGNAADLAAFLDAHADTLEPLDSFLDTEQLNTTIIPEVLGDVTVEGHVVGMPVNIHRENALFYNKQIFGDHGIAPPTTVDEFLSVCATLEAAGITPVATGYQGWIQRIMFNSLAMGTMGAEAFHEYMTGGHRDDEAFRSAVDTLGTVLSDYTNADASEDGFGWTQAADAVYHGEAAMFFHGDWVKGYFVQLGWEPGVDFGVVGAPGASDMFWYGVDTFSLPKGGPNPEGAFRFLRTIGSQSGQIAFNTLKGSTPIRLDVDPSELDIEGRKTLNDLSSAAYRMRVVNLAAWDDALLAFAMDRDADALIRAYDENPPVSG